ncbi:MAG: DNA polymerase III subunit epsilon [Gammaproteobacteria bacterium]|nr:MAG: DNA polymerase III subunit epsilon [Gammaproteobacteria bacterium]RLA24616.1 MAG: DNA polymerase III subunit epsilon [Gammaproteobacteria bacterium]
MFSQLFGLEAQRKRLLKKAPEGALRDFLSVPFPELDTPINKTPILAVDFETTGLNIKKDKILSVGFISMENNEILLSTAYHRVIYLKEDLTEENVIIHQIMDSAREQGDSLEAVISELLKALAGKVMLVHYARIEKNFLERACKKLYGVAPVFPIIDTLVVAKNRLDKQGSYKPAELRLSNLRDSHKLPAHYAHNALNDALATAEVLMAEVELIRCDYPLPLKKLLI